MSKRHENNGLRKLCDCARRNWPKCSHPWHFNFKLPGGKAYRFSLNKFAKKNIDNKTDAEALADKIRDEIREGTFGKPAPRKETTLAVLFDTYLERYVRVERKEREGVTSPRLE
ncbi:MAG: hypothetical protein AB7H96_24765 [Vicinamibacterales bacterium]